MSKLKLPSTYISFDVETTGLDDNGDVSKLDVIEFGAVLVVDDKVVSEVAELCCSREPLTKKIVEITGITDAMLVGCRKPEEVFKDIIMPLLKVTDIFVGNNIIKFDRLFVEHYLKLNNIPLINPNNYWDVGAYFKSYRLYHRGLVEKLDLPKSNAENAQWATPIMTYSYQKDKILWNLDASSKYLGVSPFGLSEHRHRALYDAQLAHRTWQLLKEEINELTK